MEQRITQLDGIRGIAALSVVIAHYFGEAPGGIHNLAFGWLGVEIFFVLSGFLIGGIILDEKDKPGFWTSFYVRRTARILPLYLLTVAFVIALGAQVSPLAYLTFTQNFVFAAQGMDAIYTHPLWTIAVEEQFYLVLPLAIVLTPKRFLLPLLVTIFASAVIYREIMVPAHNDAMMLLPGRMDLLTAGVIAAWAKRNLDLSRYMLALRCAPMVFFPATNFLVFHVSFEAFAVYGQALVGLGVASFILAVSLGAPEFKSVLSGRVLGFFGSISYGVYLLHQPINTLLHRTVLGAEASVLTPAATALTFVALGVTVLVAWVSWIVMERPILTATRRWLASTPPKAGAVPAVVA